MLLRLLLFLQLIKNLFQSHGLNILFMNSKSCNNLSKCFLSHNFKFITCVVYCDLQSLLIDFYVSKDEMHVSM